MKKILMAFALAAMAGCATVELSSSGKMEGGDRLLVIQNNGYELFWCVPLWSGRLSWDEAKNDIDGSPVFFRNNSNTQRLYDMACRVAEREDCDLVDVTFIDNFTAVDFSMCYGAVKSCDTAISAVLRPRKQGRGGQ